MKQYPRPSGHTSDLFGGPTEPWITRQAVNFLDKFLTKDMVAVEFGSGSSTRWIADRVKFLISIENDKQWYNEVNEDIKELTNIEYKLVEYDENNVESKIKAADAIHNLTNIDFLLIDGRLRVRTILTNFNKVKIGGVLMLDNAERFYNASGIPWYGPAISHMRSINWDETYSSNGIIQTLWWRRK